MESDDMQIGSINNEVLDQNKQIEEKSDVIKEEKFNTLKDYSSKIETNEEIFSVINSEINQIDKIIDNKLKQTIPLTTEYKNEYRFSCTSEIKTKKMEVESSKVEIISLDSEDETSDKQIEDKNIMEVEVNCIKIDDKSEKNKELSSKEEDILVIPDEQEENDLKILENLIIENAFEVVDSIEEDEDSKSSLKRTIEDTNPDQTEGPKKKKKKQKNKGKKQVPIKTTDEEKKQTSPTSAEGNNNFIFISLETYFERKETYYMKEKCIEKEFEEIKKIQKGDLGHRRTLRLKLKHLRKKIRIFKAVTQINDLLIKPNEGTSTLKELSSIALLEIAKHMKIDISEYPDLDVTLLPDNLQKLYSNHNIKKDRTENVDKLLHEIKRSTSKKSENKQAEEKTKMDVEEVTPSEKKEARIDETGRRLKNLPESVIKRMKNVIKKNREMINDLKQKEYKTGRMLRQIRNKEKRLLRQESEIYMSERPEGTVKAVYTLRKICTVKLMLMARLSKIQPTKIPGLKLSLLCPETFNGKKRIENKKRKLLQKQINREKNQNSNNPPSTFNSTTENHPNRSTKKKTPEQLAAQQEFAIRNNPYNTPSAIGRSMTKKKKLKKYETRMANQKIGPSPTAPRPFQAPISPFVQNYPRPLLSLPLNEPFLNFVSKLQQATPSTSNAPFSVQENQLINNVNRGIDRSMGNNQHIENNPYTRKTDNFNEETFNQTRISNNGDTYYPPNDYNNLRKDSNKNQSYQSQKYTNFSNNTSYLDAEREKKGMEQGRLSFANMPRLRASDLDLIHRVRGQPGYKSRLVLFHYFDNTELKTIADSAGRINVPVCIRQTSNRDGNLYEYVIEIGNRIVMSDYFVDQAEAHRLLASRVYRELQATCFTIEVKSNKVGRTVTRIHLINRIMQQMDRTGSNFGRLESDLPIMSYLTPERLINCIDGLFQEYIHSSDCINLIFLQNDFDLEELNAIAAHAEKSNLRAKMYVKKRSTTLSISKILHPWDLVEYLLINDDETDNHRLIRPTNIHQISL